MRYLCCLILCYLLCAPLKAQQSTVFMVAKQVQMIPDVDTLYAGRAYEFKVSGLPLKDIRIKPFSQGIATISDSSIIVYLNPTPNWLNRMTLKLLNKKGRSNQPVFEKTFYINEQFVAGGIRGRFTRNTRMAGYDIRVAEPYPPTSYTIPRDSAIVVMERLLNALKPTSVSNSPIRIILRVVVNCRFRDVYVNYKMALTPDMRRHLSALAPGCVITIPELYYYPTNPRIVQHMRLGPYEITIRE